MTLIAEIGAVYYLFGGAALLSLIAFGALILVPTMGSFGRGWEKAAAAFLSLFVLVALLALGFGVGVVIVYYWSEISSIFG
jgi:hypothetical protein